MRRALAMIGVLVLTMLGACGGDDNGDEASGGGEERTVLVDYRHDEFAAAFLQYYPEKITVRPGDTVEFRQAWTGEAHSVTMGRVVDEFFEILPKIEKYNTPEDALAAGETPEFIEGVLATLSKVPAMTDGYEIAQAGAQPCFVADADDVPAFKDPETEEVLLDATCPTKGDPQPAFNGRQALYNSGFIPYVGEQANNFTVPVAADASPGTYQYFCNYHYVFMSGSVEVVEPGTPIPSQREVSEQARKEIKADAAGALAKINEARDAEPGDKLGDVVLPLAGRETPEETPVIINEFLPKKATAKVGQKVTWTFDGAVHTVSFNVPKYFPIFEVDDKTGKVVWDPDSNQPVGWDLPVEERDFSEEDPPPVAYDAGRWDGKGGFHSSGALSPPDSFSVTFTKAGTYPYACVLHPQMIGTLEVKS